jgi:hypothetical protein
MGLFDFFKKKKPKTISDQVQELGGPLIINGYRQLAKINGTAPTSKTSDQKIIEIYQQVGSAFKEASSVRNEHLPAGHMNTIVFKYLQVYEMMGEKMFFEHLKYEVDKYINEGLRDDYKQNLNLF